MFSMTMEGGMCLGFPDVCATPTPAGPIPIPYPNITTGVTANPASTAFTVLDSGMPSLNQLSEIIISNGDQPGVALGVMSGMIMGPQEFIIGSMTVFKQGMPAQRLTSMTGHNGLMMNCPGVSLVPSQLGVLVIS